MIAIVLASLLLACDAGNSSKEKSSGTSEPDKESAPELTAFRKEYPGQGVIKAEYSGGSYLVVLETLSPLERVPGVRRIELLDCSGTTVTAVNGESCDLIDAAVGKTGIFAVGILDADGTESVMLEKYDSSGKKITSVAVTGETESNQVLDDRTRICLCGECVYVAVFKNDQTTWLYAFEPESLTQKWSLMVEPDARRLALGMIGGTHDAFGQMTNPYTVFLDTDDEGCAYVAISVTGGAFSTTLTLHNKYFGESLVLKSASSGTGSTANDTLLTKVDPLGARLYSTVIGTTWQDELHGVQIFNGRIITYGRSALTSFNDWDPYLTVNDCATGGEAFAKNYDFGGNEIFLAAGCDPATGYIYAGGCGGWTQNPEGVSVSEEGSKLFVSLNGGSGNPVERIALENGARQNQVCSVQYLEQNLILIAGWENGPGTHSGDENRQLVFADGYVEVRQLLR